MLNLRRTVGLSWYCHWVTMIVAVSAGWLGSELYSPSDGLGLRISLGRERK